MKNLLLTLVSVLFLSTGLLSQEKNFTITSSKRVLSSGTELEEPSIYNFSLEREILTVNFFKESGESVHTLYEILSYKIEEQGENYIYKIKVEGQISIHSIIIFLPKEGVDVSMYVNETLCYGEAHYLTIAKMD